ncbi:MAG: hypothetical protein ACKO3N_14125 [Verrucomicrobiota bacterium]
MKTSILPLNTRWLALACGLATFLGLASAQSVEWASGQDFQHPVVVQADVTPPVLLSGPTVAPLRRGSFVISWVTDERSTTVVRIRVAGSAFTQSFSNKKLVLSHSLKIPGTTGVLYEYTIESADQAGNTLFAGPFTYQN